MEKRAATPTSIGNAMMAISTWKALPIHLKTAVLFMYGIAIPEAFHMTWSYLTSMTNTDNTKFGALMNFMHTAITSDEQDPPESSPACCIESDDETVTTVLQIPMKQQLWSNFQLQF